MEKNEVRISRITNSNEIYAAICLLSEYLFNQSLNCVNVLKSLSEKYSKNAKVLIASIADEIKGLCVLYDNDIDTRTAFLSMIVVSEDAQGKGIGNALLSSMLEQCKVSGMERLRLEVANTNANAIRFYCNRGFAIEKKMQDSSYYYCTI